MTESVTDPRVPYSDRLILLKKPGAALIWPFINDARKPGALELFLDNNALTNVNWLGEARSEISGQSLVVNPWLAITEQWVSNPEFRANPEKKIQASIGHLEKFGCRFPDNYAASQANRLRVNHQQFRYHWAHPLWMHCNN